MKSSQAASVGLIVNELVTNAFKYAFPEGRSGTVEVDVRSRNEKVVITGTGRRHRMPDRNEKQPGDAPDQSNDGADAGKHDQGAPRLTVVRCKWSSSSKADHHRPFRTPMRTER